MYTTTTPKQLDAELRELEKRLDTKTLDVPEDYATFSAGLVIRSGNQRKQMFLYRFQQAIDKLFEKYPSLLVIKTRQTGLSQQAATKLLHKAALSKAYNAVFFSLTNQDLSSISKRISEAIETNRWGLSTETDNVTLLKLLMGGMIGFRSYGGKSAARGVDSVSTLVFDECAFAENLAELMGAASASTLLVEQPNFIYITTPSTPGCTYYELLSDTVAPLNIEQLCEAVVEHKLYSFGIPGFMHIPSKDGKSAVVIVHWSAHPVYATRPNFLAERQAIEKTSMRVINREYGLKWDSGVGNYFSKVQIANACILPPIGRAPKKDPTCEVVIGIDPAGGAVASKKKSPDYCVAIVLRRDKKTGDVTQVAMYRDNTKTSADHIKSMKQLLQIWQPDKTCCETVGLGGVFYSTLSQAFPTLEFVEFNTTARKKISGYGRVTYLMDMKKLALWNTPAIKKELNELQDDGKGKIEAPPLNHDDIPMALMLGINALHAIDYAELDD